MPSAVSVQEFLEIYPEFQPFSQGVIQGFLDLCEESYCPVSTWATLGKQRHGIMLRTAHILECQRQQMAQTASMGAAVSLGQPVSVNSIADDLDQSTYGRQFKQLRRTLPNTTAFWF